MNASLPVEEKQYRVDIIMEFPRTYNTEAQAHDAAERIMQGMSKGFPDVTMYYSLYGYTPDS